MIFLDNGSTDRTVEILTSLKNEGLDLTCFRQECCFFLKSLQNTILYNVAARYFGADWVAFLDTDEFLDARTSEFNLRERLSNLPPDIACLKLNMVNYQDSNLDDPTEPAVPRRITRRWRDPHDIFKVCLRGNLQDSGLTVDAGNHEAFLAGNPVSTTVERNIILAHFVRRSPWQEIAKQVIGRLKVLAAGQEEIRQLRSSHYTHLFDLLKRTPEAILRSDNFMQSLNGEGFALDRRSDPVSWRCSALYRNAGLQAKDDQIAHALYRGTRKSSWRAIGPIAGFGAGCGRDSAAVVATLLIATPTDKRHSSHCRQFSAESRAASSSAIRALATSAPSWTTCA